MVLGFIILRHVNSELTNNYWIECYDCIRKFYAESPIMIIDDNSNYNFITEKTLTNTVILKSEFKKGKGEILPYFYYYKNKFAESVVFIHDSVFIQEKINFGDTSRSLWSFPNNIRESIEKEKFLISKLKNCDELLTIYDDSKWLGCFGSMSFITYKFLEMIVDKYNLFNLIDFIDQRIDRMYLERVLATILFNENCPSSMFGNILEFCNYGYTFNNYIANKLNRPIIKVWTGR